MERYEALRASALGGDPSGFRLGLAVLAQRGVAAWARVSRQTTPLAPAPRPRSDRIEVPIDAEVVTVLVQMALGALTGG